MFNVYNRSGSLQEDFTFLYWQSEKKKLTEILENIVLSIQM